MVPPPAAGRLLIASAALTDPNFSRTVVLLLEHGKDGTVGVVLNRPTDLAVAQALPEWSGIAADPGLIFRGGPVGTGAALALGVAAVPVEGGRSPAGWRAVVGPIGLVNLDSVRESVDPLLSNLRIYIGHAGWSPGQLDGELSAGAWIVVDALPQDVLSSEPARLWSDVLRRLPGEAAFLSTRPDDPNLN
ncbi:MAG TPA: YqgE/AlgH family protein [Sporichthyaceae bacterium]|jgi:putative transcriptional regulator|nr:YqgE/AlgH family protein [Sporichthyaceae bacterium]